ncbi:hypothetical protein [Amphritea pacifica]|uniref:Disulfide bond formation protein B n=1 Tax=Amphritea pacifica TaxID=2811233 RepID=A0ABS2WD24_9GAMM|nr:hypothetical protein [Amphritea pacifica]MBN0989488.1 hypothetical protein [Amphritea pacifica]
MLMELATTKPMSTFLYAWPLLIGIGCFLFSSHWRVKSFSLGILKGFVCLLVAVVLSWLCNLYLEQWVVPYSTSTECIEASPSCSQWILRFGEWLDDWSFIILEILAVIGAVFIAMRQVTAFNKAHKQGRS